MSETILLHAYKLSPQTIRSQGCPCQTSRRHLSTAPEYMGYQLSRLDKLWRRMKHSRVPAELTIAAERVYHTLRGMGWELAHLIGKKNSEGDVKRDSWSVIWMVPACLDGIANEDEDGDDTGHIILAEIMIQMFADGKHRGKVENVVVRFCGDWSDWTTVQPNDYVKEEGAERIRVNLGGPPETGKMIMGELIDRTQSSLPEGCEVVPMELQRRVSRALEEVARGGMVVEAFEVEKVYRQSNSLKHVIPAVRIGLVCEGMDTPGAVVLLDTSGGKGKRKVKHIAVIYADEWPICHHYKAYEDEPRVDGLNILIRG